jgi:dihydrofolate reductase
MRKLIVSMNTTLDGFMSGPHCELDWHFRSWTSEMAESLCEQLNQVDTILLGRVTYLAMAQYWPSKIMDMSFPREDLAFVEMMNSYTKVVISKTLARATWSNSRLLRGNLANEIRQLKTAPGKDMIIYGSGQLVAALTRLNLVDEFQVWVHPVVLGRGKPLFRMLSRKLSLKLSKTKTFTSGVVLMSYQNQ